jgi:hypothetical protein
MKLKYAAVVSVDPRRLEEFLESLSEKDQAKLWDALAARLAPYISAVTIGRLKWFLAS